MTKNFYDTAWDSKNYVQLYIRENIPMREKEDWNRNSNAANQSDAFVIVYGAQESIPPVYVARRAATKSRVVIVLARQAGNRFLCSSNGLQIRAQDNLEHAYVAFRDLGHF